MTINDRIKYFRKDVLHLNQTDFAKKIGIKQTGVSYLEKENTPINEQSIKTICLVFDLNEDWLRYGSEPMYSKPQTFNLEDFIKERGGTKLELELLKTYFEIDPAIRKQLLKMFTEKMDMFRDDSDTEDSYESLPKTAKDFRKLYPPIKNETNTAG